jgi:polyferredoxin
MESKVDTSLAISNPHSLSLSWIQKFFLALVGIGFLIQFIFFVGSTPFSNGISLVVSLSLQVGGILGFSYLQYDGKNPGIKNNGVWFSSLTSRGSLAWIFSIVLTAFYVLLYWYPEYLGLGMDGKSNTGLIRLFDPLSFFLKNKPASQWFVYGVFYTLLIFSLGIKFIWKYRHSPYQRLRTISIIFFQTCFAFLIPEIMLRFNMPYNDFKNVWPLNYYFFFDWHLTELISNGTIGIFILGWGIFSFIILTPILTYFYGKRWYCSWVCGCGGLAETAGDSFRQLSDKSLKAWKIERWMIHSVLVFVTVMTILVLYTRFTGNSSILFLNSNDLSKWYGFFIGSVFSGVIGVGFYPLMGTRVWCRFGCPMAAYLGILQKYFSRFRITVNGGQCISCGNCSTYCEMGIDVKAYAQRGQDIVRASCVGCGICSAVCPRGVLRLENGTEDVFSRANDLKTFHITKDGITF